MEKIKKILVANRAEIATRVIRTASKMGISTVAIYAEDDKNLPYVSFADEAVCLGSGSVTETYLDIDKIINICKTYHVDAIHPGYGFLSENELFAKRVSQEKLIFIGPSPESIKSMGDKVESKKLALEYSVPVVPGYHEQDQSEETLLKEAKKIGFPMLIKASAGGGGKGMRICHKEEDFLNLLSMAKSEALKFFKNDKVLLEKYVTSPRHIEVQVFGDAEGGARHFFERECSIQRRYQKIVEETPSTALSDETRRDICETALRLVRGLKYSGAGTVEFILDENSNFYFLEMNTRLQVEHPITEMITGRDLVDLQIKIAQGEGFNFSQEEVRSFGHAIECRIYAESPEDNFLPQSGVIGFLGRSKDSTIRLDTGYEQGCEVGINYDPMIAKIITFDESREANIRKMREALRNHPFLGMKTNRDFLIKVLEKDSFKSGDYDTHFIQENEWSVNKIDDEEIAALLATYHFAREKRSIDTNNVKGFQDVWASSFGWLGL